MLYVFYVIFKGYVDVSRVVTDTFNVGYCMEKTTDTRGELNGMKALITGKYKVMGDVTLMMKWGKLFG